MALAFLKNFKKGLDKIDGVNVGIRIPSHWYSTGNYALNKSLSGSYFRGVPEGRIMAFVGPSGSGKSYLASNLMKSAQQDGAYLVVLDSENALDTVFLNKIGVLTDEEHLTYIQVGTIEDVNSIGSEFFTTYEKEYGRFNPDAPRIFMVLDSIAMLSTSTEEDNYDKGGVIKGDQGQRSKRTKAMLRMMLSRIARLNITVLITDHVYPQDIMMGDGPWAITNSTKFFPSIIGLITKLKLKEDAEVVGVRMRVETYKSRFSKLGTKIELEVPYSTGMSPYSGLLDYLEADGVVTKGGAWYSCSLPSGDIKFQRKQLNEELVQKLLSHPKIIREESELPIVSLEEEELVQQLLSHSKIVKEEIED